jgi:hypothetical protein
MTKPVITAGNRRHRPDPVNATGTPSARPERRAPTSPAFLALAHLLARQAAAEVAGRDPATRSTTQTGPIP